MFEEWLHQHRAQDPSRPAAEILNLTREKRFCNYVVRQRGGQENMPSVCMCQQSYFGHITGMHTCIRAFTMNSGLPRIAEERYTSIMLL